MVRISLKLRCFSAVIAFAASLESLAQAQQATAAVGAVSDHAVASRVDALLKAMTTEEKTGQMMQYFQLYPDTRSAEEQARKGQIGSLLFMTDPKAINRIRTPPWRAVGYTSL